MQMQCKSCGAMDADCPDGKCCPFCSHVGPGHNVRPSPQMIRRIEEPLAHPIIIVSTGKARVILAKEGIVLETVEPDALGQSSWRLEHSYSITQHRQLWHALRLLHERIMTLAANMHNAPEELGPELALFACKLDDIATKDP